MPDPTPTPTPEPFQLPAGVADAVAELARRWESRGLVVSMFGSFARGEARRDSDIDLAVEWTGKRQGERDESLWCEFLADVDRLPTVRRIDVVDVSTAEESFIKSIRPQFRRVA